MAILKMKKIREMNEKELDERMRELKLELSKENASSRIGTVKNPGRIREIRRTIARINTVKDRNGRRDDYAVKKGKHSLLPRGGKR